MILHFCIIIIVLYIILFIVLIVLLYIFIILIVLLYIFIVLIVFRVYNYIATTFFSISCP